MVRCGGVPAIIWLLITVTGCAASRGGGECPLPAATTATTADARKLADANSGLPDPVVLSRGPDEPPSQVSTWQASHPQPLAVHVEAARGAEFQPGLPPAAPLNPVRSIDEGPEQLPPGMASLVLDDVIRSVYQSYPLLRVAVEQRGIADGQLLEAEGEFDFKTKGGGTSGPLGFYETHRIGAGFEQALFGGGQVFAGYRIGRGNFQPWYGERETNDGGEFKAGFLIPLLQNRRIDPRRAAIFRAALGRDAVEPDILLQMIDFVRAGSYSYWEWVAAGQNLQIAESLLEIAQRRQEALQQRVLGGDLPRIDLTDNQRLIVSRQAALVDARRKFEQSAIKLSLFLRAPDGQPLLVSPSRLPAAFPTARPYDTARLAADIQVALASRPEIQFLDFVRAQLEVDVQQARNLYLPEFNVGLVGSQDVGAAASAKGDKTPFELEASLMVSVPLQRRKAIGKLQASESKLLQVTTKTQFVREKIATDVRTAVAALTAAFERIEQTRQSAELNLAMEQAERNRFDQGDSNLLVVNLREQATADARKSLVTVYLEYFQAEADYQAALAAIPIPEF